MSINFTFDAQNLYGIGTDSLDLDQDGSHDLFIHLNVINPDSQHLITGWPNLLPSCRLSCRNGFEVALYVESYPIGMGQSNLAYFADRLDHNERIDQLSEWDDTDIRMWAQTIGGVGVPPYGDWYFAGSENYLALRNGSGSFVWIKIDGSTVSEPQIISYAISN